MSVLDQCFDIINLTSLDWPEDDRYAVVGHSFRVMAKARNYDELVVGMMHALYAASSSTRGLYSCDVDGDPEWRNALDLFVPPLKVRRFRIPKEITEEYLLNLNMPCHLSETDRESWMLDQTNWSPDYADYIRKIRGNRIARNVMIHKLEDMIDVLEHPGKYEEESGPQRYVLPWKKHQTVGIPMGRNGIFHQRISHTDDPILLRDLTDEERGNLIEKYGRAQEMLLAAEERYPVGPDYSFKTRIEHEKDCHQWFLDWKDHMEYLKEMMDEGEDEAAEYNDIPF